MLRRSGFEYLRQGKGAHEIWSNGKVKVTVPYNLVNRNTANDLLKEAGIDKKV
jgi:hypothetical protein